MRKMVRWRCCRRRSGGGGAATASAPALGGLHGLLSAGRHWADPRPRSERGRGWRVILWTAAARAFGMVGPLAAGVAILSCSVPMVLWSLLVDKVHRNPSTGIDWDSPPRPLKRRDRHQHRQDRRPVGDLGRDRLPLLRRPLVLGAALPLLDADLSCWRRVPLVVLSVPYVIWARPAAEAAARRRLAFRRLADRPRARGGPELIFDFLRSWAIKAFFLAFMLAIVPGNWEKAVGTSAEWILASPAQLALWLIAFMFMIDVTMASIGYVLTMKPLDAHIRSANPYASAWMAALMCYPPFIMMDDALNYHIGTAGADGWIYWLEGWPVLQAINGAWLVFLTGVYAWATVAFGIRFSNLTHRGILTHGPYAWSKHPAYVSKNLFWWFAVYPFLVTTGSLVDAVRNTVILGIVSGIYYWRAKTEERHLIRGSGLPRICRVDGAAGPVPRFVAWVIGAPRPRRRRSGAGRISPQPPRSRSAAARCQGQRPSISTSSDQLRKVRISTIPASTSTLSIVGSIATVLMMSAATRNSRPSRIARPRFERRQAMRSCPSVLSRRRRKRASATIAPIRMIEMPRISTMRVTHCTASRSSSSSIALVLPP
jgi:protein-S-isoprenylcysteine O-methyltransferase Ste14